MKLQFRGRSVPFLAVLVWGCLQLSHGALAQDSLASLSNIIPQRLDPGVSLAHQIRVFEESYSRTCIDDFIVTAKKRCINGKPAPEMIIDKSLTVEAPYTRGSILFFK